MVEKLDNYCGFYCKACSIRYFQDTGCTDGLIDCLSKVPKEGLVCGGCKSDSTYPGCRLCKMRECAVGKEIERCTDCREYPCRIVAEYRRYTKFLPHAREMAASQDLMKEIGIEKWLSRQKERWSCPDCGTLFSWYARVCSQCGRDLSNDALTLKGFQRFLGRLFMPKVYKAGKKKPA